MATYPHIGISAKSRAVPLPGHVDSDDAEDGTGYTRRYGTPRYQLTVEHRWITLADFDTIVAVFDASLGPHDVTINGKDYTGKFTEEPRITGRNGPRVNVRSVLKGNRNGW